VADAGSSLLDALLRVDQSAARSLNLWTRRHRQVEQLARGAAGGLASAEVALMLSLVPFGQWRATLRMLCAVSSIYVASEMVGLVLRRQRPFATHDEVEELLAHRAGRSFPSRHVASAIAMARIGRSVHPRLGWAMAAIAWLLGLSRTAAGLHYPSDVLAGAILGSVMGRFYAPQP
jgi:membrane-associated phospholipid phosphatase